MTKLWQKEIQLNKEVEEFTAADQVILDQNLISYEVLGSLAHGVMLAKLGILTQKEWKSLKKGLKEILILWQVGKFNINVEDEDVHTAVENYLTEKYSTVGQKIHTARSRNDQVLVDLRLYTKEKLLEIEEELLELVETLLKFSKNNKKVLMPGYTHMQKAMLSSVGLWASSFVEALLDDLIILEAAYKLNNQSPLGSAAGFGVSLNIDRKLTAHLLGFEKVQNNTLYCQNSRGKIEAVVLGALVQIMLDLSKLAQDILLFTTSEFGFFEVSDKLCTGSSIMPQKKNLDVMELVRAKAHQMIAYQNQVLGISAGLPSGYNRDLQETKKPLMGGLSLAIPAIKIVNLVFKNLKVSQEKLKEACEPEIFATDHALKLIKKGIPFRKAYQKAAKNLSKLPKIDPEKALEERKHLGGLANLGLSKLNKQIRKEKASLQAKKAKFKAVKERLLDY